MDHIGAHLQHTHVEPISFGIDQILNNVDQSCMLGARMLELDYGHSCIGSTGYNNMTSNFACNNSGYNDNACGVTSINGSYNMNMGMNVNGNNVNAAGVIRVPAHRPMGNGLSSIPSGMPTVSGAMNNLTGLTFPWMESNRRYTKDRFTGSCMYLHDCRDCWTWENGSQIVIWTWPIAYIRKKEIIV